MTSVMSTAEIRYYCTVSGPHRLVAMTATVNCTGVRFAYGGYEALHDVDIEAGRGEIVVLAGANGAGKTTLLEIVVGLRRPVAGTVRVLGRDPWRERRRLARDVGVVFQECGCATDLTVAETVRMWLRLRDRPGRGEALTAAVGLERRTGVRVGRLSGGERRRLDLAVALVGEPALLVLDEPESGLDPDARKLLWDLLRARRAAGATILLATHHLDEAHRYADRVTMLTGALR